MATFCDSACVTCEDACVAWGYFPARELLRGMGSGGDSVTVIPPGGGQRHPSTGVKSERRCLGDILAVKSWQAVIGRGGGLSSQTFVFR